MHLKSQRSLFSAIVNFFRRWSPFTLLQVGTFCIDIHMKIILTLFFVNITMSYH